MREQSPKFGAPRCAWARGKPARAPEAGQPCKCIPGVPHDWGHLRVCCMPSFRVSPTNPAWGRAGGCPEVSPHVHQVTAADLWGYCVPRACYDSLALFGAVHAGREGLVR